MDQIGRYKLEAELGRGGCGRVYRAFDPTVGRTVAIKLLITNTDKELLTRFRNEASASGKLHHRNIVTVYDFGEQDGTPYLVMEYLQGEDLHKLSAKGQQLTLIEKMSIMAQVAEGLHHAHQNGIVHRDVKPANIMVLSDGSVKIMDFGIARLLSQTGTRLTRDGAMIGTVSYMAPEQFQGGEIDALCDIWAYGLIYYELVTGYHPFNAPEPGIAIYNITAVDPPPVRAFVHDCPPALEDIIMRAIRKDRNLRYQSLEDVQFDVAPIRLDLQRERAEHLMIAAEEKFTVKDVTGAQLLIREILDLDPSNASARRLRETINRESEMRIIRERTAALKAAGTAELGAEQYAKAVQTFESALRLDPQNTELHGLLQQAREGIDKTSRAAVLLVQARHELRAHHLTSAYSSVMECLQNTPRSQQANDLLVAIQKEIEVRDRERRLNERLTAADALIRDEQYDEALRTLVELEASYPESQKVKETLAAVHLGIEEGLREQRLEQGLDAGKKLIDEHAWQQAIDWLTTLRGEFPVSDEIPPLLAHAEGELREQEKSEHIERVAAEARTLTQACEFERALDFVEGALRVYPDEPVLGSIRAGIVESQTAHERQVGIRDAEEAVLRLLAAKLFDDADAVINRAIQSWDDPQLHALRRRITDERQEHERAEAITRVSAEVQALIRDEKIQEALDRAQSAVREYGDVPELTGLVGAAAALKRAEVDSVLREAAHLAEAFEFDGAIALLMETSQEFPGEDGLRAEVEALRIRQIDHDRSRAEELIRNRRLEEAAEFLEESLRRHGGDVPLNAMLTGVRRDIADQKRAAAIQRAINQADVHAREGDFESAITALHRLDEADRSDPQVIAKLDAIHTERAVEQIVRQASSHTAQQHFDSALKAIEQGLRHHPQHPRLTTLRQDTIAVHNDFKRERSILTAIQKSWKLRAKAELDSAIQIVEAALRSAPEEPRLLAEQASLRQEIQRRKDLDNAVRAARELAARGRFDEAQESLDAARRVYGDQRQIASAIGDVQTARRIADINNSVARIDALLASDPDEAARQAEQALRTFPNEPKLLDARHRCRESLEKRRREAEAQARATEARRLMDGSRFDEAVALLEAANAEYPSHSELSTLLKAAVDAQQAQRRREADAQARATEAQRLMEGSRFDEAVALLEAASAEYPERSELSTLLKAAVDAQQAQRRREADAQARATEAQRLMEGSRFDEAVALIEAASAEYPERSELSTLLKAAVDAQQAQRRREAEAQARATEAQRLMEGSRFDEAVALLEAANAEYPSHSELSTLLKAAVDAQQAQRRREADAQARATEAQRLMEGSRFDEAVALLEAANAEYPERSELSTLLKAAVDAQQAQRRREAEAQARATEARKLMDGSRFDEAVALLEAANAESPSHSELSTLLKAAVDAQQAQRRREADAQARATEAQRFMEGSRFDEAVALLEAASAEYPERSELSTLLKAAVDAQQAQRRREADAQARATEARRLMEGSRFDEAVALLEAVSAEYPERSELSTLLKAAVDAQQAQRRRDADAQTRATEARRLMEGSRFDEAVALLEAANAEYPSHSELSTLLKAAADAQQARRRAKAIESVIQRGSVLLESAKYTDAQELVSSAVSELGGDERLLSLLTTIQTEKRRFEEEQTIKTIVEEAEALVHRHRFSDAARMLAVALRKHPNEPRLLDSQSRTEARRRDHERALRIASAIRQAREHLEQDRPNLAVSLLQPIVHDADSDADVRRLFDVAQGKAAEQASEEQIRHIMHEAESASEQKNYSDAARYIEAGLSTFPDEQRLRAMKAEIDRLTDIERQQKELLSSARAVEDVPFAPDRIVEEGGPADESVPSQAPATHPETVPALSSSAAEPSLALSQPVAAVQSQTSSDPLEMEKRRTPPVWRWVAAGLAAAFVLAIAVFLFSRGASKPAELSVRTVPAGATIRIAGKTCSQEPCTFEIPAGKHDVEVTLPGYRAIRGPIVFDESHTQHMFTMEPLATRLQVVTNLSEGTVLLDGRPTGALKAGEFQLEPVPVGWHTLQVNSNDVASASLRFEAVAGRAPQIEKTVEGKEVQAVAVSNLGQEARLVSTGTGSVTLDGRPAGELTRDGLVLGNLGPGTHAVRLQAGREGLDYVIAAGDMPSLSVFMTANRDVGSLVVETREDDVRVFVDGERWARSSQQGIVRINNLPVREHSIRVEKPGFKSPTPQKVAVSKGTLQRISFRLEPLPATLVLSGAMPQTQLSLDGRPIGTAQGNTRLPIVPGAHVLRLAKDGYVPKEISIRVDPGGTFNLAKNDLLLNEVPRPSPAKPPAQPATVAEAPKPIEPAKTDDLRPPDVREWEQVQNNKDINRLEQFRKTYPKSPLSETAAHRIEVIEWENVRGSSDPKILQEFLNRHPRGEHSDEARKRVEQLEWAAVGRDNAESLRAFIRRFPASDHAAEAKSLLSKVDEAQDVAAIRQALDKYSSAMSAKNVDEVTRIWKNAPTRVLTDQFKILREISVQTRLVSWKIEGDRATVQCLRTSTAHLAAKPRPEPPRTDPATVTLRRQGGAWVIEDVQAERAR